MPCMIIFVWEDTDWSIKAGYVYSLKKAEKIRDILQEDLESGWISWFKEVRVFGYQLSAEHDLPNIRIKNGEIELRGNTDA